MAGNHASSVSTVTRLRVWTVQPSHPWQKTVRTALAPFQPAVHWLQGLKRVERELFDKLHIVLKLRLSGAMPPLPLYASMTYGHTQTYEHMDTCTHRHTDTQTLGHTVKSAFTSFRLLTAVLLKIEFLCSLVSSSSGQAYTEDEDTKLRCFETSWNTHPHTHTHTQGVTCEKIWIEVNVVQKTKQAPA